MNRDLHAATFTTPSDHEITVTRVFDAPRELVYEAFTKPEIVRRWLLGPDGWSMPICEMDVRPGGRYRWVWRHDGGGTQFGISGTFHEVVPPERISTTERFEGISHPETRVTIVLTDEGRGTRMSQTLLYASKEDRDGVLGTGMTSGMEASYSRLAETLASP